MAVTLTWTVNTLARELSVDKGCNAPFQLRCNQRWTRNSRVVGIILTLPHYSDLAFLDWQYFQGIKIKRQACCCALSGAYLNFQRRFLGHSCMHCCTVLCCVLLGLILAPTVLCYVFLGLILAPTRLHSEHSPNLSLSLTGFLSWCSLPIRCPSGIRWKVRESIKNVFFRAGARPPPEKKTICTRWPKLVMIARFSETSSKITVT